MGPNVRRLIIRKLSVEAVPPGGGFASGLEFLSSPEKMRAGWEDAARWVDLAIQAVRQGTAPNPWAGASDEAIAGELLRLAEEKDDARRAGGRLPVGRSD